MSLSLKERNRRYKLLKGLMVEKNLDFLVVAGRDGYLSRGSLRYVSNYGVNFGEQYCLFPADGEPLFLGSIMAIAQVLKAGWIGECRELTDPHVRIIEETTRFDRGKGIGLVGLPFVSVPVYLAMEARFKPRLVDGNNLFKEARLRKSGEEIENVKTSTLAADRAYEATKEMVRPGVSDFEIFGEVKRVLYGMGAEYSMEFIDTQATGLNFYHPLGNILNPGGTLKLEITPACGGYYGQLTATIPVTVYPPHIESMLPVWREALEIGESLLKPGVRACDVHRAVSESIRRRGYVSHLRTGHGIGLDAIDFFSLSESETTELQEGVTLAFHPCVAASAGGDGIGMGYTYLITEKGCEKLSRLTL